MLMKSPGEPIPAGELRTDQIRIEFAVYYLPEPGLDPSQELDSLLAGKSNLFERIAEITAPPESPKVSAFLEDDPAENYVAPDLDYLHYFGRGLTQDEAVQLQDTQAVFIMNFAYPDAYVWSGLREAAELAVALAERTDGLLWDETTREVFTPEAWREIRLSEWDAEIPEISSMTVIHAYQDEEYVRAVTLGMEKFGLPDLVIENFSWSLNRNMGHILNLFGQAVAENPVLEKTGEYDLDIRRIQHPTVRNAQLDTLEENATGIALLSLHNGKPVDGDPDNRLIEITFERGAGPDIHARQEQILMATFGWKDSLSRIQHDETILAASEKARERLPELRSAFNAGLAPGESLLVKAPFKTPDDSNEWMWVEVISWKGDSITGLLRNEPFDIPDLHAGQKVEVSQEDVFDYIRQLPDGTLEGNETGKVIDRGE